MKQEVIFAASILSADFSNLKGEIRKCEDAGVDRVHLDVMDGHFVPNLTIGPVVVESIRKITNLPLDVHLMIESPEKYIDQFTNAGADLITFHVEEYRGKNSPAPQKGIYPRTTVDMDEDKIRSIIEKIKAGNVEAALALNPPTPFFFQSILRELDEILIMSVNPGFGGQELMPSVVQKIRDIRKVFDKDIKVDGGINEGTIKEIRDSGANVFVIGSYFFRSENPKEALQRLKNLI